MGVGGAGLTEGATGDGGTGGAGAGVAVRGTTGRGADWGTGGVTAVGGETNPAACEPAGAVSPDCSHHAPPPPPCIADGATEAAPGEAGLSVDSRSSSVTRLVHAAPSQNRCWCRAYGSGYQPGARCWLIIDLPDAIAAI